MSALFLGLQTERILLKDRNIANHLTAITSTLLRNIWTDRQEPT